MTFGILQVKCTARDNIFQHLFVYYKFLFIYYPKLKQENDVLNITETIRQKVRSYFNWTYTFEIGIEQSMFSFPLLIGLKRHIRPVKMAVILSLKLILDDKSVKKSTAI